MLNISLQLIGPTAKTPTKGSVDCAGYDLYSTEEYELKSMERKLFSTHVKMAIPQGFYGRIAPRSGLALKNGIDVLAGVIDADYRGEVGVLLVNLSTETKKVSVGDKIAQIIFEQCMDSNFSVVENLETTERGSDGFGSTGDQMIIKRGGGFFHPNRKISDLPTVDKIKDEDSIVTERLSTVAERKVEYIDVGTKTPEQISNLVSKWKEKIRVELPKSYESLVKEREQSIQ
jgi:dUTP pyrophosphatase